MTAELQNVAHKRGTYRVINFGPVKNPKGELIALIGAAATWRMAKYATSEGEEIYVTKDSGSSGGIEIVESDWFGQTAYTVRVILDPADTMTVPVCVPPHKHFHECEVITVDGHPIVVATGWFDLQPSITAD